MNKLTLKLTLCFLIATITGCAKPAKPEWQIMFDGSSLDGWKSNDETAGVFTITDDGSLKVDGGRAHLYWVGHGDTPEEFKDFQFKAKVKTTPGSNSGIFFHTKWVDKGWPKHGYEAQVNSTHKDRRKTGSIYAAKDVLDNAPSTDGEWFDYEIRVEGKTITILVNGEVVNQLTEPDGMGSDERWKDRKLTQGLFALQGHDPKSVTYFKDIAVKVNGK